MESISLLARATVASISPTATAADRATALSAVSATDVGTVRDLDVHVLSVPAGAADNVAHEENAHGWELARIAPGRQGGFNASGRGRRPPR